jgi:hypothetical protein
MDAPGYETKTSRLRRYPYGAESVRGCLGFEPISAHSTSWRALRHAASSAGPGSLPNSRSATAFAPPKSRVANNA